MTSMSISQLEAAAARGVELNRRLGRAENIRFFAGYLKALRDVEKLVLSQSQDVDGSLKTRPSGLPIES